jgi:mannose-1-phosphate guanylyltransferase/phosphomannomutase
VTVRLDPADPQSVVVRFLDAEGIDLDEATQRKIERLYDREELRRVVAAEIGDIDFPARTAELYTAELVASIDTAAVRAARFKLVLDYAYGTASLVMPSVLGKLGAEVLVVNPLVSTVGVLGFERVTHATRIGELVRSAGAHLGAVIGPDGEVLTLVDDRGRVLADDQALLAFVRLVCEAEPGAQIAVPVTTTWAVNELCAELGGEVIWAKLVGPHVLDVASSQGAAFAASAEGGYAFPRFLPAYDAVTALVNLLAFLARRSDRLSALVDDLPRSHVVHEEVPTPSEQKGTVMRLLSERARGEDVVLVDGVKTIDVDGWTLVLPDPALPLTHIYAESRDETSSRARLAGAAAAIAEIVG